MYDYACPACDWTGSLITPIDDRDAQYCDRRTISESQVANCALGEGLTGLVEQSEVCDTPLDRVEISLPQPGRVDYRYQTKAILTDGTKIPGSFGKAIAINKGAL